MDIVASARSRSIKLTPKSQINAFSRSNTAEYGSLIWKFDSNNQYLHPKLVKVVYSRAVRWTVAILTFPMFFTPLLPRYVEYIYFGVVVTFVIIPFLLLLILSFNRDASGFIIKSSEFWIKIIYALAKAVLQNIKYHIVLRHAERDESPMFLGCTIWAITLISEPLTMVFVGGMDAIPRMTHKWKAILTVFIAGIYTIQAIQYQFLEPRELDYVMTIEATRSDISLNSLISNAIGMIAIFSWKQAIDIIRNRNRCISITYRPYLQWLGSVDDSGESGLLNLEQMPTTAENVDADINTGKVHESRTCESSVLYS